jgi:hypothetical protein
MMGLMSTEPQAVVEFGAEPEEPVGGRRRWNVTQIASGLADDRRAVPLAAAVGAVALFAALVSEWQVTVLDASRFAGGDNVAGPLTTGIADLGALGGGFLAGMFVLVAAAVLVIFGPVAGHSYARLVGLSTGGVLLALLAALASTLGDSTRAVEGIFLLEFEEDQMQLSYGRGIWCALFGVLAMMLALYLSGRSSLPVEPASPDEPEVVQAPPVWSWRRPRAEAEDQAPDAPLDLSVTSTTPFTSQSEDRDKGISG